MGSNFAIGWFTVKHYSQSKRHFKHGYANIQRPFNVWTETPTGGAVNFITGAGGFLQSIIFGASGMRICKDHLYFDPVPPSATGTNAFQIILHSFQYLGSRLRQNVTAEEV